MSRLSYEQLLDELERTRADLRSARDRIAAMEMSRFWKLRNLWWKVRPRRPGEDDPAGALSAGQPAWWGPSGDPAPAAARDPRFAGRRILFVLPVRERGGGANVVFSEAAAMRVMGVDARVASPRAFESDFRAAYARPPVPVAFAAPSEVPALAAGFDAVIATANRSVEWLLPLAGREGGPVLGYYVQDFEPYFYEEGSSGHAHALASYTLIPGLVRFAKTEWNAREVTSRCAVPCAVVGPSFDAAAFSAREGARPPAPPVRIAAMIRPSSPRRQPGVTLAAFERLHERHGQKVVFTLFGVDPKDPEFLRMPRGFPHRNLGIASDERLADLFNESHVFADFSSYQAMGLTAMEAMACGAAAIVPRAGGADSFARDGENALVVDTASLEACVGALERFLAEPGLAARLGERARTDMAAFPPERAARRILELLFGA